MSWCDKLASTPAVGFRLEPHVTSGDALIAALSPVLNRYAGGRRLDFNIEAHDSISVAINSNEGFRYALDPNKVSVGFNHRMRAVPVSAGPPTLEMLSRPLPYTELLPTTIGKLIEATLLLPEIERRGVMRIGIVTTTQVVAEEAPPGILRLVEYVTRPWAGDVEHFNFTIAGAIGPGDGWTDACIHTIVKPEDPEGLMTITFDWGRTFDEPQKASEERLKQLTSHAQTAALGYFEELAEGSRFDAELISPTA